MKAVFVAPHGWEDVPESVRALISETAKSMPVIFASPEENGLHVPRIDTRQLSTDTPLELQPAAKWLSEIPEPVLVATHLAVEPVTISRRYPVGWIETSAAPRPVGRAVALAQRSSFIAAPSALASFLGLDRDRFIDLVELHEEQQRFLDLLEHSAPRSRGGTADGVLAAEVFNRTELASELMDQADDLSDYTRVRIMSRLDEQPSAEALLRTCLDSGDHRGVLATLIQHPDLPLPDSLQDEIGVADGVLRLLFEVSRAEEVSSLLEMPIAQDFTAASRWKQRAILSRLLDLLDDDAGVPGRHPDKMWTMLTVAGAERVFGPEHVNRLASSQKIPVGFLERVAEKGGPNAAMSARLELHRREWDAGGWVDPDMLTAVVASIDSTSWHEPLWRTALTFWQQLTGEVWALEGRDELPPEPPQATRSATDTQSVDARARSHLAAGRLTEAIIDFEEVRSLALSTEPPTPTTELAARLNIGWAMWKLGRDEHEYKPYLTSVLEYVRPSLELVELRKRHVDLIDAIVGAPDKGERIARDMRQKMEELTGQAFATQSIVGQLKAIIDQIDRRSTHPGLWHSGLAYWTRITGSRWNGSPIDPSPPTVQVGKSPETAESVAAMERMAKRALSQRRRRRAARLFNGVRVGALRHDPPLRSTEQAARLNIGWILAGRRRPESEWRPFITSVLEETRPERPLVELRAELAGMLEARGETV